MGTKVHPTGLRLGNHINWDSSLRKSKFDYANAIHQNLQLKEQKKKTLKDYGIIVGKLFIRQIKTHKCEITGCRKDLFNILFNFPKKNDHVEIAYRDAINHYRKPLVHWATNSKNVLTLPVLKLDEKTTRGIGTYYTEL